LIAHGWETPTKAEADPASKHIAPMSDTDLATLYLEAPGPADGTVAHAAMAEKMGFGYRTLLGEILYAYVLCRSDIGYAITTLAKFSTRPTSLHYNSLKRVAIYLRQTIDWGIMYWRPKSLAGFPIVAYNTLEADPKLPVVPVAEHHLVLVSYVDSGHANEHIKRRSTTGYGTCLSGGVISYRSKTQPIVAGSSTEAELVAAHANAKVVKYLRFVMHELGFTQDGPTIIYEDNDSTIKIVNNRRPTDRARHIDIRYFSLQQWRELGDIILKHIPGIINPADDLTKPVGWVLHERHARFLMGHYGYRPPHAVS
jgi:hypothetical protein